MRIFFIEDSQTHFFLLFIKVECTNDKVDLAKELCRNDGIRKIIFFILFIKVECMNIGMFYVWYNKVDLAKDLCRYDGILKIFFFSFFLSKWSKRT